MGIIVFCPNCGKDVTGAIPGASHDCEAANLDLHAENCDCVHCQYEQQFATGQPLEGDDLLTAKLDALLSTWNIVSAEYESADFARKEELVEVQEKLREKLASYLDVRAKRKFLQRICKKNVRLRNKFASVASELHWCADFDRAMRLG
jgi:hypothetical protein